MIIKPTKTVLAVIAYAVVVLIVATVIVVTSVLHHRDLVREHPSDYRPKLSVATGTNLQRVAPIQFCADLATGDCDPVRQPAKTPTDAGHTLSIALPPYIQERPWSLLVQYYSPGTGEEKFRSETHIEPGESVVVLPATDEWLVAAVEITVPSTYQDQRGELVAQAKWSLDALPDLP